MAGQLHLYRVEINWKYTPPVPTKPGQPPPPPKPIHPELDIIEILVEDHCYPTSSPLANGSQQEATEAKIRVPAQLTHLNFLPKTPRDNGETLPTIQAIFSTPPNIVSFDQTQSLQNSYSILVRWEVHTKQQNQLHSSLDKVTSKKKSVGSVPARQVFLLNRLSDTVLHTVVLSFYPLWYNMVLAFCYSDGTIVFRKRTTMEVMGPDYNFETVTSLCQAGFAFSAPEPALHLSLSPNHCIAACMQQDGSMKLRPMEYTYGTLSTDDPDPRHSAALAALVLQTSSAANQLFSSDDIFAIAGDLSEQRKEDFILSMFQALSVDIDCGVDDQAHQYLKLLGRSPSFIKTLSSANLLGLKGTVDRSVSAKMAWQILNIKHITQLMTTVTRLHQPIEKSPIRPELIPYIIGISRWIMHFITYLLDDIFALGYHIAHTHPPNTPLDRAALEAAIATAGKSAILLLLSSFPRMVMKLWSPSLTWLSRSANIFAQNSANPEVRRLYMPLHEALHELPFGGFRLFELFTMEATQLVRAAYRSHNLTDVQRNECEKQIVLGHIPDVLVPVAKRLLTDSLFADDHPNGCLADKLDYAKITFFDTTWLGLTPSNVAREWHATHTVDVCLKTIISGDGAQNASVSRQGSNNGSGRSRSDSTSAMPGDDRRRKPTQLKRCVRCGSYMEDVMHGMPGHTKQQMGWLMSLSRHCVCGNSWVLEQEKSRAE
jgi:mediator of RNA polymerase II transcription subunit 16